MIVHDDWLLAYFRTRSRCELCGRPTPHGTQPHHIRARGMGGGSRLDVVLNLIGICMECHEAIHNGRIRHAAKRCWWVVDWREGLQPGTAEAAVNRLLLRSKAAWRPDFPADRQDDLPPPAA